MSRTSIAFPLLFLGISGVTEHAQAQSKCRVQKFAELPVTMDKLQPLIKAKVNGVELTFVADSGGFYSMITKDAANSLKLRSRALPDGVRIQGIDGAASASRATVKDFALNGYNSPITDIDFIVNDIKWGDGIAGLIGQNILGQSDAEYDLANGVIRLIKSDGCETASLAYWSRDTFVGVMPLDDRVKSSPHHSTIGQLNGRRIRLLLDSGASRSFILSRAAVRLGVYPGAEGVVAAGAIGGVGGAAIPSWLARFDSLDVGGEQIKNAQLRIGASSLGSTTDMLLGADFFLSHRIFISKQHKKIFFTYNGGPVFDLGAVSDRAPQDGAKDADRDWTQNLKSASAYKKRAKESMRRFDHEKALADYDRAVSLEPEDAENFRLRALAKRSAGQRASAEEDYGRAISLDPNNSEYFMERAELRMLGKDLPGADSDFEKAIQFARKGNDAIRQVASLYEQIELYDQAIKYLSLWLERYPNYYDREWVLNQRCWVRALNRKDLELALEDCNGAVKRGGISNFYDSRAMVLLQLGRYKEAAAEYEHSLRLQPWKAWSHYGLGVARVRLGEVEEGKKSIEWSIAENPAISEEFARLGIEP